MNVALNAIIKNANDNRSSKEDLSDKDIPRLREQWFTKCADIMKGVPEEL
jgi:hypothetical protein